MTDVSGIIPDPMRYHTATIDEENQRMLVFGGLLCHDGVAYSLDLTEMKWSIVNDVKYERWGHSANLIANSVYLFGGANNAV